MITAACIPRHSLSALYYRPAPPASWQQRNPCSAKSHAPTITKANRPRSLRHMQRESTPLSPQACLMPTHTQGQHTLSANTHSGQADDGLLAYRTSRICSDHTDSVTSIECVRAIVVPSSGTLIRFDILVRPAAQHPVVTIEHGSNAQSA